MAKIGHIAEDTLFEPERHRTRPIDWDRSDRGLSSGRAAIVLQSRRRIHGRNRHHASINRKALAPREPSIHCSRPARTGGLGRFRRGEAVLDAQFGAELVEFMLAGCGTLAQAERVICELLAVACWEWSATGGYGRARSPQIAQRAAITGAQVSMVVLRTTPSRRPDYGQDPEYP